MTKIRKQKRKKRFRANVNRKRLRNKLQKLPKIECEDIENSWELKRSIRTNLKDMGLAYDPNEALNKKIPSTKLQGILKIARNDKKLVNKELNETEGEEEEENDGILKGKIVSEKIHVANKLEADAKAPRERMFRLPNSQVFFVTYLMDKYGDDYKAMARDRKNHYQMTWCQIRAKINTFKSIPEQYAEYLLKSGEIVLDDPTPLAETRRKLGEENAKKFCAPKKRKLPKERSKSLWEVETVQNENENENKDKEFRTSRDNESHSDNGLKKLKLFSDEEESDEETNVKKNKKKKKEEQQQQQQSFVPTKINDNKRSESKKTDENLKISNNSRQDLAERLKKLGKNIEKSQSSDSDSEDEELEDGEGGEEAEGFMNLSDMSEEELSEDDVLDDGEFVTDSDESD